MKKIIIGALTLLLSQSAFAHVETGSYEGALRSGEKCFMEIKEVRFENGAGGPLNERVLVKTSHGEFTLRHIPKVNDETNEVDFEEGILREAFNARELAVSLSLYVVHAAGKAGPDKLTINTHNWKNETKQSFSCLGLKKIN